MIEVMERNWLARMTSYRSEKLELNTPEILYISTDELKAPDYARIAISDKDTHDLAPKISFLLLASHFFDSVSSAPLGIDPGFRGADEVQSDHGPFPAIYLSSDFPREMGDIVPVGDALLLSRDPRKFSEKLSRLRSEIGPEKLIYIAGIADPFNLSLLCYLGADLVDSFGTILRSSLGQVILNGRTIRSDSAELDRVPGLSMNPSFAALCEHNLHQLEHELFIVRDAIRDRKLRQLVELRVRHSSWMVQALRFVDREEYDSLEHWIPIFGGPFLAHSKESLWRPDIERYRRRIRERYVPPSTPEILLLLPCSARKPYSTSRSHRMFREIIRMTGLFSAIHEVIITSPLGIVPRELELVYPAQQYDIPVTGHWDEDEKEIVRGMLSDLLARRRYAHIIAHLDIEMQFLQDVLGAVDAVHTGGENVTSRESLRLLEETLASISNDVSKPPQAQRTLEDITGLASYQFGDVWPMLMERIIVRGRYPMLKLLRDGMQICSLVPDRGCLALTLVGGETLAKSGKYGVEIEDFSPQGNVFAVGVVEAAPEIRVGDEVYVHYAGDIRAVGVARMTPIEMTVLKRGEAVHIRHCK